MTKETIGEERPTDGDNIARKKFVTLNLGPFGVPKDLNRERHNTHRPKLCQRPQPLPDDCTLKHDEHEQREQAIVPIFIKTPERHTKDLEEEEWC